MADKTTAQEQAEINKAIEGFGKETLTEEQENLLIQNLHSEMMHSITLPEAVRIAAAFTMENLKKQMESMSDEEKMKTYKDLGLK